MVESRPARPCAPNPALSRQPTAATSTSTAGASGADGRQCVELTSPDVRSDLADRAHGILDALGVGLPEPLELRRIEVGDILAQVLDGGLELLGDDGLLHFGPQLVDDRRRRALGREQPDPQIELDVVAVVFIVGNVVAT